MFEKLTIDELLQAQKDLQERLQAEKQNVIAEIAEKMKAMNISIADIQGFFIPSKRVSTLPPKYRNPDNPDETWVGRGKAPKWLADKAKEISKESMLIAAEKSV